MRPDLNPADVVAWLRGHARECSETADRIERAFAGALGRSTQQISASDLPLNERIRKLLSDGKARRSADIARILGVSENEVTKVVASNGTIERRERGWIGLVNESEVIHG